MISTRALFALALAACGPADHNNDRADAAAGPDAAADAAPDAPPEPLQCMFVASTAVSPLLTFTYAGGSMASYGCAPIDPTYWMSGAGMSATVTFAQPQKNPSIRVWGMNTDDTASIAVNGAAYSLGATSATLAPKVVCGLSPGPDGVEFVNGTLAGANTPGEGNYSYQDITLNAAAVQSVKITGLSGAGWGFVGASVCGTNPNPL